MKKLHAIVSGYATVDFPLQARGPVRSPGTFNVEALFPAEWPRAGGAALYAGRRIAAAGHHACAFVGLGDDANAHIYSEACVRAGVETISSPRLPETRTPSCILVYHDDGSTTCLIDRGGSALAGISDAQLSRIPSADFLCLAAGPPGLTAALLNKADSRVPLAWIVKADAHSFPEVLCERLARRADVIFCNRSERALVDSARRAGPRSGQIVIETRGSDGVVLERADEARIEIASPSLRVRDATGAGDTFAGEVIAAMMSGYAIEVAARRGIDAAVEMLRTRVIAAR